MATDSVSVGDDVSITTGWGGNHIFNCDAGLFGFEYGRKRYEHESKRCVVVFGAAGAHIGIGV